MHPSSRELGEAGRSTSKPDGRDGLSSGKTELERTADRPRPEGSSRLQRAGAASSFPPAYGCSSSSTTFFGLAPVQREAENSRRTFVSAARRP